MALDFNGRVAIVTGAGGALGRCYALEFALRGAKVVINDFNPEMAQKVVDEIKSRGGEAVPNSDSVTDGAKVVQTAIDNWGRVDILVNNAGILRDVSFAKMTDAQWQAVLAVHVQGSYAMSKAAWPHMRKQMYGRIVNITSINGLYGAFGQANYSSAKMALVGMAKTLAKEGAKKNIKVNCVAPGAGSAMTMTIMPKEMVEAWKAEYVSPTVAWLCHEQCPDSGKIFEAGGGFTAEVHWSRTKGHFFDLNQPFSIDDVKAQWGKITDRSGEADPEHDKSVGPQLVNVMKAVQEKKTSKL